MKHLTKGLLCLLFCVFGFNSFSQSGKILESIQQKMAVSSQIENSNPFTLSNLKSTNPALIPASLTESKTLRFEPKLFDAVAKRNPEILTLDVPAPSGETWRIDLEPSDITSANFLVNSTNGYQDIELGQFYHGVVEGHPTSLVSLSFIENEIQALIAIDGHNYTLGKLLNTKSAEQAYIIYNEAQVPTEFQNFCGTQDPETPVKIETPRGGEKDLNNCVNVYFELDYDVFQNKGSVQGATNYMLAVFNEVATLYANESIITKISEIFVWDSPSPYNSASSTNMLNGFRSTRPNFNGDIGHLVDLNPNNGGVAYVDVICNNSYNYAYSGIYDYYSNVPTYSWTVEVITHEIGHNLGSPHTHSCSWPGGPIDNCYPADGFCGSGPAPQNGGTIMSYCHLTSHGINFNNGFGPLPGDLIRNRVSNASCLTSCDVAGVCSVPGALSANNITINSFDVSWNAVSSAVSYDLRYRIQGSSTWTTLNTTNTSVSLSGLNVDTSYEVEVQSNCDGEESAWSTTLIVSTLSDELVYCNSQGADASYEWIASVNIDNFSKNSGSAQYSDFTTDVITLKIGASNAVSLTPGFASSTYNEYWKIWADLNQDGDFTDAGEELFSQGLSSTTVNGSFSIPSGAILGETRLRVSMKYNAEQTGPCETFSYGEVEDYTLIVEENIPDPCDTPENLSVVSTSTTSISLNWAAAGSNETGYRLQHRPQGSTSWTNQQVSGTSFTLSGLNPSTTYQFRVRAACGAENSAYSSVITGTTDTPAPCDAPANLNASNVTSSEFTLSWSAVSAAHTYTYEFRVLGTSSWNSASTNQTQVVLNGLAPDTDYEARVRSNCEFENSGFSAVISVRTEDGPVTYCDARGNNASDEWIQSISLGSISNSSGNNGGYGDFTNISTTVTAGNSVSFSLSPGFPNGFLFGAITQPEYWAIYVDYNQDGDFTDAGELAFDAGGTSTSTVNGSFNVPPTASAGETRVRVVMKRSARGQSCETFANGEVEDYSMNIEPNIPQPCNAPSGLASSGETASSLDLSWNAVSPAISYTVEYRTGSGSFSSVAAAGTSTTISGLASETSYEFRISSNCGSETSAASASIFATTLEDNPQPANYCASSGNSTSDEWIARVTIGGLNNNSGNNSGYGDFTNQSVTMAKGASQSFTLRPGFNSGFFGTTTYPEYWRIWIDLNQDGDFTDAGELVFDAGGTSTANVSGSFTLPSSALIGNTRMRVSMKYNGAPSSCENFAYGEVEDYTVTVVSSLQGENDVNEFAAVNLEIKALPNPAVNGITSLQILSDLPFNGDLSILDVSGRVVYKTSLSGIGKQLNELPINLSNQARGMYLVSVQLSNGQREQIRIVHR